MVDTIGTLGENEALTFPGVEAIEITAHDTNDLAHEVRALYIGTGGDVEVITKAGSTIVFPDVVGGTILPIRCTRVKAGNTTASGIVGIY